MAQKVNLTKPPSINKLFLANTIRSVDCHNSLNISERERAIQENARTDFRDRSEDQNEMVQMRKRIQKEDEKVREVWLLRKQEKARTQVIRQGFTPFPIHQTDQPSSSAASSSTVDDFIDLAPYSDGLVESYGKKRSRDGIVEPSRIDDADDNSESGSSSGDKKKKKSKKSKHKKEKKEKRERKQSKKGTDDDSSSLQSVVPSEKVHEQQSEPLVVGGKEKGDRDLKPMAEKLVPKATRTNLLLRALSGLDRN